MKVIRIIIFNFLFLGLGSNVMAQESNQVDGNIMEKNSNGSESALPGVSVYWMNTNIGVFSDASGHFNLTAIEETNRLIVSLIGYETDTVIAIPGAQLSIVLSPFAMTMEEVDIVKRKKSTETSFISPIQVERINEKELQKAACCSLSESFETSPTVDVSFTDAVTGTRQIEMLGLAGPNVQITREAIPTIRGLNALYGLELVPGTWIESIHLNKGTGSVVNGYESIAGQMNVELRKPENSDKLYINGYANEGGRFEMNVHSSHRVSEDWTTGILVHGKTNQLRNDRNKDGFLDNPLSDHFFGLNRWKYIGANGLRFQAGAKVSLMNQQGGQLAFNPNNDSSPAANWGMLNNLQRYEGWAKLGKVFEGIPWRSIGMQVAGSFHNQETSLGHREYLGSQNSAYFNSTYQSILSNTNHKFKTGISVLYDDYSETLDSLEFDRLEIVPGTYFEYTYNRNDKFNAVLGIRGDYHNNFGAFVTPRIHLRYEVQPRRVLRAFAGRGQRTASVIAENFGMLSSSRQIIIEGDNSDKPYGLNSESAWNVGVGYAHCFELGVREGTFKIDFHRTDFINQIVVDRETPQIARFYNLDGKSYSNSISAQIDYELAKRLDVRIAYRFYDVKTTYGDELLSKPFVSSNRAFINFSYETSNKWKFDMTFNWQDQKRIPSTTANPEEYRLDEFSPDFFLINSQISKRFGEKFEAYAGVENLLNYTQKDPIIASEDPFSQYFDSSLIWGPIFGRNTYVGFRYRLK